MELQTRWHGCDVYLHRGDLTLLDVDALVNAANPWLCGGGGVDGAIHRRGGPAILEECQRHAARLGGRLPTGQAVLTTGGDLPARHVIHAVGPVYDDEPGHAAELLAAAYRNSLAVARAHGLRSIAFPCISTGVYGYPPHEACPVALAAVRDELGRHGGLARIIFCTFTESDYQIYLKTIRQLVEGPGGG